MTGENTTSKEETPSVKTIGLVLEMAALPVLIIVAVLMNMKNINLGIVDLLLGLGVCMFAIGLMLSHLPKTR